LIGGRCRTKKTIRTAIVVAFNIMIRGLIDVHTARFDLR
jgi:hypothetical protein